MFVIFYIGYNNIVRAVVSQQRGGEILANSQSGNLQNDDRVW